MSEEPSILAFVHLIADTALKGARTVGGKAAHLQVFDANPTGSDRPEVHGFQGSAEDARGAIAERLQEGFEGFAGFTCVEQNGQNWQLRAEGFDTRNKVSAAAKLPLKRGMLGKFKPLSDSLELEGDRPEIPGVFVPVGG